MFRLLGISFLVKAPPVLCHIILCSNTEYLFWLSMNVALFVMETVLNVFSHTVTIAASSVIKILKEIRCSASYFIHFSFILQSIT